MDEKTKKEAGCRATEILTRILEEHEDLYISLACTGRLLAHGAPGVVEEMARTFEELKKKSPEEVMDLVDLLPVNPFVGLLRAKSPEVFFKVEREISAAVLISAHAFFEATLRQLLELTILCERGKWLEKVAGRNVIFGDVVQKGPDACADELLKKELASLQQAGMPTMVSRLLGFCKGNVTTKSHFQHYVLDIDRLKTLDQRRHDYAHRRTKARYSMREADADLRYLTLTAIHLVTSLMEAFGIKGRKRSML